MVCAGYIYGKTNCSGIGSVMQQLPKLNTSVVINYTLSQLNSQQRCSLDIYVIDQCHNDTASNTTTIYFSKNFVSCHYYLVYVT